eukprot:15458696-Alexandrium_andersonii.AAC.2
MDGSLFSDGEAAVTEDGLDGASVLGTSAAGKPAADDGTSGEEDGGEKAAVPKPSPTAKAKAKAKGNAKLTRKGLIQCRGCHCKFDAS